jgi:DNA end-binding protein Ku
MAPRPYWSGHVQISLVSFGVRLFTATETKSQISLRELDRRSGERIHHKNFTESDEQVDRSEIVKGFEYSKGEYVVLEPEELKQIRIPSKKTLQIAKFVDPKTIDLSYFEKPYFVVPEDEQQADTYSVIRKAMADSDRAGLGEIAFGGREHLVALMPLGGKDARGMMAYTLRYPEELRDAGKIFGDIHVGKLDADQLDLAKELIKRNSSRFDPSQFKDDYEAALREVIDAKMHHRALPKESTARRGKVVSLTDALRQSLGKKGSKSLAPEAKPARKSVTASGRRTKTKGPTLVRTGTRG